MFRATALLGFLLRFPDLWAQSSAKPLPRFEDYPAGEIYRGPVAAPKIATRQHYDYRTRIRQGVSKGWGAGNNEVTPWTPRPNYAGKMIVVQWGCGAPCIMMAMVDAESGTVYSPPVTWEGEGPNGLGLPLLTPFSSVSRNVSLEFRPDSRLMVFDATPKQDDEHRSYTYYFLWEGDHWKLLRQIPLRDK